jgi:hypothetical protein
MTDRATKALRELVLLNDDRSISYADYLDPNAAAGAEARRVVAEPERVYEHIGYLDEDRETIVWEADRIPEANAALFITRWTQAEVDAIKADVGKLQAKIASAPDVEPVAIAVVEQSGKATFTHLGLPPGEHKLYLVAGPCSKCGLPYGEHFAPDGGGCAGYLASAPDEGREADEAAYAKYAARPADGSDPDGFSPKTSALHHAFFAGIKYERSRTCQPRGAK